MNHHIIKQIVVEMFDEARKICPSDAHTTLSYYIEDHSKPRISYRTAARAYKKYIEKEEMDWSPNPESVENFCKHIGYEDFKDYVEKNLKNKPKTKEKPEVKNDTTELNEPTQNTKNEKGEKKENYKNRKWIYIIVVIFSCATVYFLYDYINKLNNKKGNEQPKIECMAWAKDHYEKIDCDLQTHPDYGTKVESYKPYLKKSMKKLDNDTIDASTTFFSKVTGKPLVWYYKTKESTLEYFTAPGFHPVNGETLKKITEGMIERHVPIYKTQSDSFISDDKVNSTKTEIAILILNENNYDNQLASNLKANYFNKNTSIIRLIDSTTYQNRFISNMNPDKKLYLNHELIVADTLVLGLSKYNFSNDIDIENMVICDLLLELSIYVQSDNKWKEITSKNINSIGSGYTKTEAKTNALKKINYE